MRKTLVLCWLLILVAAGCGGSNHADPDAAAMDLGPDASAGEVEAAETMSEVLPEPTLPVLESGWTIVKPGGHTSCARGGEFFFLVHPGEVNKLLIDFQGGGACWDRETCKPGAPLFKFELNPDQELIDLEEGLHNVDNPENPLADWYHIYIPYCTGDIHLGTRDQDYGETGRPNQISHRGKTNVTAVLEWAVQNFGRPERVLVTGTSAGSYGAFFWSLRIRDLFPHSVMVVFSDGGAGVVTSSFLDTAFDIWGVEEVLPETIPAFRGTTIRDWSIPALYKAVSAWYPDFRIAQFNTRDDLLQMMIYQAMGGDMSTWTDQLLAITTELTEELPEFRYYLSGGTFHCATDKDEFFLNRTGDVPFRTWYADWAEGRPVENVDCQDKCLVPAH